MHSKSVRSELVVHKALRELSQHEENVQTTKVRRALVSTWILHAVELGEHNEHSKRRRSLFRVVNSDNVGESVDSSALRVVLKYIRAHGDVAFFSGGISHTFCAYDAAVTSRHGDREYFTVLRPSCTCVCRRPAIGNLAHHSIGCPIFQ